jgi:hypothetical protein
MEASQPGRILLIDDDPALGGYLVQRPTIVAGRLAMSGLPDFAGHGSRYRHEI